MRFAKAVAKKIMIPLQAAAPGFATKLLFKKYLGYSLNLNDPKTMNEKMQWLKLNSYRDNPLITKCVDKYAVRSYVAEKGCAETLVELLGVWDSPEEIVWDKLPDQFVLKCNHGSGSVIICKDKAALDKEDAVKRLSEWLKEDFGLHRAELAYKQVDKKVICERLIQTEDGLAPKDYKIFCSYGEPKYILLASGRDGDNVCFDHYDLAWNHYPAKRKNYPMSPVKIAMPDNFQHMLDIASMLSKEFPIVRVDLYNEKGKVFFGELTFLASAGLRGYDPPEYDKIFGEMFDISELIKQKK